MNELQKQIREFEELSNDYEVLILLIKKDNLQNVFQKININKKNRSNIYYV